MFQTVNKGVQSPLCGVLYKYTKENQPMFYIARNTLAVTRSMTKKAALKLWAETTVTDDARYQLCKETGKFNPTVVMELN